MKLLVAFIPMLFLALFVLVMRWARKKNREAEAQGQKLKQVDFDDAFAQRDYKKATKLFFLGALPEPLLGIGRALGVVAVAGAVLLVVVLLVLTYT